MLTYLAMQRAQAILLVLVLFATPLALLARASSGLGSACNNLCCLRHGSHAGHAPESQEGTYGLPSREAGHAMFCSMKAGRQLMDFGFLAPLAPTAPSSSVSLVLPVPARARSLSHDAAAYSGFSPRHSNLRAADRCSATSQNSKFMRRFYAEVCRTSSLFCLCQCLLLFVPLLLQRFSAIFVA